MNRFWLKALGAVVIGLLAAIFLATYVPREWVHFANVVVSLPALAVSMYAWHRERSWFIGGVVFLILSWDLHSTYYGVWNLIGRPSNDWHFVLPNAAGILAIAASVILICSMVRPGTKKRNGA